MTRSIVIREKKLPDKQHKHTRRYKSGKTATINPKNIFIKTPSKSHTLMLQRKHQSQLKQAARKQRKPIHLTPKLRIHWKDVLRADDRPVPRWYKTTKDRLMSIEERKRQFIMNEFFDKERALEIVYEEEYCQQNCEQFEEEYIHVPLNELKEKYESGLISTEAEEKHKEIIKEAINILVYDLEDPSGTVTYSTGDIHEIGHYKNMAMEEGIDLEWRGHGYRGYYVTVLEPYSDWMILHEDCALTFSEDEIRLEGFDEELKSFMDKNGFEWARVTARSSNVFSTGVDYLVKKKDAAVIKPMINILKDKYRDPKQFMESAEPIYKEVQEAAKRIGVKKVQKLVRDVISDKTIVDKLNKQLKKNQRET